MQDKNLAEEDKDAMADFYALLRSYAVAGKAVDVREEAMDSWGYVVWSEYSRTDLMAMYLNEILEDAVCDYNVFRRDDE